MTKLRSCDTCYAFRICPQKPKRENYTDENKYLIDLECGVWDCKNTVENLWKQLTKAKEILKKYHNECPAKYSFEDIDDMAEQFLKECE